MCDKRSTPVQNRLWQLRMELGLTQAQLTDLLGCSCKYISRLERQERATLPPSFVDRIMETCRSVRIDTLSGSTFCKVSNGEKARIVDTLKIINQDWLLNKSDEMFVRSTIGKELVPFISEDGKPYMEELKYFWDDTETPPKKHYIYPEDRLFIFQQADPAEVEKRTRLLERAKMLIELSEQEI